MASRLVGLNGTASPFVELAARSGFSLLDGASNPEQLAERAAGIGLPALALADRFDLGGVVRFERACREVGVRPIVGAEVLVPLAGARSDARIGGSNTGREPDSSRLSLVLLCESAEGYHNLSALVTSARLDHPRGIPALPLLRLTGRTEGLVCLLRTHGLDPVCEIVNRALDRLRGLFPDRFWLALEHHGLPEDNRACERWLAFARHEALPWVPVNAPRYARPSGRIVHDVLICLRHGVTLDEAGDLLKPNGEWYLKGAREMRARWCFRAREAEASPVRAPGAPRTDRLLPGCDCEGCATAILWARPSESRSSTS
ncbi:MAG: PHP domain-containing protein [Gemmatimonadota bacterium]